MSILKNQIEFIGNNNFQRGRNRFDWKLRSFFSFSFSFLQDPKHNLSKNSIKHKTFTCSKLTIETLEKGVKI